MLVGRAGPTVGAMGAEGQAEPPGMAGWPGGDSNPQSDDHPREEWYLGGGQTKLRTRGTLSTSPTGGETSRDRVVTNTWPRPGSREWA